MTTATFSRPALVRIAALGACACLLGAPALAQAPAAAAPPEPPKPWAGSLSAGIALTGGNTDTTSTNLAFDLQSDKTKRNVVKTEGLNIRSSQDGEPIVNRTSASIRDEYGLTTRTFAFGQLQYLRDVFKSIDYLVAPTAGLGYRLINNMMTTWTVDGSAGAVVEKNTGVDDGHTSGAVAFGEKLTHKISTVATTTQSLTGLWKTSDWDDSLYTFQAGIAASITPRTQIKVDFLDTYKNKPPTEEIKQNDTAFLTSFSFKF